MKKNKNRLADHARDPDSKSAAKENQKLRKKEIQTQNQQLFLQYPEGSNQQKSKKDKKTPKKLKISKFLIEDPTDMSEFQPPKNPQPPEPVKDEHQKNIQCIEKRMNQIHNQIEKSFIIQTSSDQKSLFKIFTNIISHKDDIERISKQRKFIKSQQSACFQYKEPMITSPMKIPKKDRAWADLYEEKELNRQAQKFTSKVKKQKSELEGLNFLRRKLQENRRQIEYNKEQQKIKLVKELRFLQKYKTNQQKQFFINSRVLQIQQLDQKAHAYKKKLMEVNEGSSLFRRFNTEPDQRKKTSQRKPQTPIMNKHRSYTLDKHQFDPFNVSEDAIGAVDNKHESIRNRVFSRQMPKKDSNQDLNSIAVNLKSIGKSQNLNYPTTSNQLPQKQRTKKKGRPNPSLEFDSSLPRSLIRTPKTSKILSND